MGLVVQVVLASVYIIVVECHFGILNPLGLPSIHEILHGPEKHHRWHGNMFNPAYPNRQPNNMYDYGNGVNNGPMNHRYGPDGTILTYDNYGPDNGPNYHPFNDNANGDQNNHGSDDIHNNVQPNDVSHLANDNGPTHEITEDNQKLENPDSNKPNGLEANEKNNGEDRNEHGSKPDTGNESKDPIDVSFLPDKKKLQEEVFVNPDPKSSLSNGNKNNVNKPITNYAIPNSNLVPLSSSSISQNVPAASNVIIVPLPNTGGVQSNPGIQIIGTDAATGLPVINVNGALYYYINPANNQVTTQKPVQIILLPTNGPKPALNVGTGSINAVPANPNYIIVNGNGQTLQPLNNGINKNGIVNIEDIRSYIQQHPELLQLKTNTASIAPNSQAILINPEKPGANSNPINGASATSGNASPVVYQPTQNAGSQTNTGISTDQVANSIISFILQHPEIFGSNAVSNNAPNSILNGNVGTPNMQNPGQGGANINPAGVVPTNAIGVTSSESPVAYQPAQNTGTGNQANGDATNDIQRIIAIIAQHPEIFGSNAVSNNAPNPNGNNGLNNPNNIQNSGQGAANNNPSSVVPTNAIGVTSSVSPNAYQPAQNTGSGNQANGDATNDIQRIIAIIAQHPEIFGSNAVSNNAPNPNGNNGLNNPNNIQNSGQGAANNNPSSVVPNHAIDASGAVSSNSNQPIQNTGSGNSEVTTNDAQGIIAFMSQHPEIFAANAVVPSASNLLNGSISTLNTQQDPDQGSRNSFSPSEPVSAIGASNNVKIPVDSQGPNSQTNNEAATTNAPKSNLIVYLTQHPDIYGPKPDANNTSTNTPIEDKNGMKKESDSLGNIIDDTNKSPVANGNMPSYIIVQDTGNRPTNQPPNDSGIGLPLKTNVFNNDDNNGKVDINTPMAVLGLSNTKDLEGVRVNKKATDAQELPKNDGAMSATKDIDDPVVERTTENISSTLVPAENTILQETSTQNV